MSRIETSSRESRRGQRGGRRAPSQRGGTRRPDVLFGETWSCGHCGRTFDDCTSCCAHESQCGGHFSHC